MIGAILKGIIGSAAEPLIDRLVPDLEAKKEFRRELALITENAIVAGQAAEEEARQTQLEINKIEAAHRTIFVAGWRPAVGWVCAVTLAFTILIVPLAEWGFVMAGREMALPRFPEEKMMLILVPMLGLGGYRTIEKLKDKAK